MYVLLQRTTSSEYDFDNTRVLCASKDLTELMETFNKWFDKWKKHPEQNPVMDESLTSFTAGTGKARWEFKVKETTSCDEFNEKAKVEDYSDDENSVILEGCRDCLDRRNCQNLD